MGRKGQLGADEVQSEIRQRLADTHEHEGRIGTGLGAGEKVNLNS